MIRKLLFFLFFTSTQLCEGQVLIHKELMQFKWTTDLKIDAMNLGSLNEIGLTKLKVPLDSLKEDCVVWTFEENKIFIQKYSIDLGLEADSYPSSYEFKNGELTVFHFAQDSNAWKYKVGMVSTASFILLIRKHE